MRSTPEAIEAATAIITDAVIPTRGGPLRLSEAGDLTLKLAAAFDNFAMKATSPQGWRIRQALDARRG